MLGLAKGQARSYVNLAGVKQPPHEETGNFRLGTIAISDPVSYAFCSQHKQFMRGAAFTKILVASDSS